MPLFTDVGCIGNGVEISMVKIVTMQHARHKELKLILYHRGFELNSVDLRSVKNLFSSTATHKVQGIFRNQEKIEVGMHYLNSVPTLRFFVTNVVIQII